MRVAKENGGLGTISTTEVYPLPIFVKLAGLSAWAMRQAKRKGLAVKVVGRRKYVRGEDWHKYLETANG